MTKITVIVVSVLQLETIDSKKKLQNFRARYLEKKKKQIKLLFQFCIKRLPC